MISPSTNSRLYYNRRILLTLGALLILPAIPPSSGNGAATFAFVFATALLFCALLSPFGNLAYQAM